MRYHFDDKTLEPIPPVLGPGEKLHVPIHQDETVVRSNELRRRIWVRNGRMPLRKKSQGKATHMSSFIIELLGRLALNAEQIEEQKKLPVEQRVIEDACEIIYPGKNADGWWNAKRLIDQVNFWNILIGTISY